MGTLRHGFSGRTCTCRPDADHGESGVEDSKLDHYMRCHVPLRRWNHFGHASEARSSPWRYSSLCSCSRCLRWYKLFDMISPLTTWPGTTHLKKHAPRILFKTAMLGSDLRKFKPSGLSETSRHRLEDRCPHDSWLCPTPVCFFFVWLSASSPVKPSIKCI